METSLSLTKSSLLQLDPISHKHTLRLLPLGKNNRQKIVVGDDSGLLYSYDFHKGEPIPVFSTKVFEGPISCVALGGATPFLSLPFLKIDPLQSGHCENSNSLLVNRESCMQRARVHACVNTSHIACNREPAG